MKKWTKSSLEAEGYTIENATITHVDLSMADHGCLTLKIALEGKDWCTVYGGYALGHGYLDAEDNFFEGSKKGLESIMRIMDTVGVECFNSMRGKIVRTASKGWGSSIKIIGNAIKEKWFDAESFYSSDEG